MILMSPRIRPGKTAEERSAFLRQVEIMEVKTVSGSTPADWSDADVEEAKKFLDDHGIRMGEFSGFHSGFGAGDEDEYQSAIEHYRHQLRHASILGAHCVEFNVGLTTDARPKCGLRNRGADASLLHRIWLRRQRRRRWTLPRTLIL